MNRYMVIPLLTIIQTLIENLNNGEIELDPIDILVGGFLSGILVAGYRHG